MWDGCRACGDRHGRWAAGKRAATCGLAWAGTGALDRSACGLASLTERIATPGLTLIRVQARTAEWWDSPGLMGHAKAVVTGKTAGPGAHRVVEYPS